MWSFIKIAGFCLIALISYLISDQYIFTPHYALQIPKPFKGNTFYNPYKSISLNTPLPINLHGHTQAWQGLTNGKGTADVAKRRYDSLGFYFTAVSQYHLYENKNEKVSVYEHGINLNKVHQLILGGKNIEWKDYFFPQSLNQKQHILNLLSKDTNIVIGINHPGIRNGYKLNDFKFLQQYHLMEGVRPNHNFINYWDTALKYGHPITLIGNDDYHNIYNDREIGNHLTILFQQYNDEKSFLAALKNGHSATVSLNHNLKANLAGRKKKIERLNNLISKIIFENGIISIQSSEPITINWKSNQGLVKQSVNAKRSFYKPNSTDFYVRIEVSTKDSIEIYFNPLYRSDDGNSINRNKMAKIYLKYDKSYNATIIGGNLMLTIMLLSLLIKFWRKKIKSDQSIEN